MEPTRPTSLLNLAASLGSEAARSRLSNSEQQSLDDGFRLFMSTADFLPDGFEYHPPILWPYTHEAALRMGIAAFREYIPDWQAVFQEHGDKIPANVAPDFPGKVLRTIEGWLDQPQMFDWDQHGELYCHIKETCLDGYLPNDFPEVPKIVSAWCLGSLMLNDASNWEDPLNRRSNFGDEFNLDGVYSGNVPDGIAFLLEAVGDDSRIRMAIAREVIPWCLERS